VARPAPRADRPRRAATGWRDTLVAHWSRPRPSAISLALLPLAWLYTLLSALHRGAYAVGWLKTHKAPVPLVVVGNLVAGGAGKTPTVIALVQSLRSQGWTPGVIARGYGAGVRSTQLLTLVSPAELVGDEPLLIHRRTGAPVCVAVARIEAARALCTAHPEVDILVADDGLQHHALARDAQVLVFDERGVGNGLRLPAGPLRQALPRQVPAASVVLYNASHATTPLPGYLGQRALAQLVPLADWWHGSAPPDGGWQQLRGQPVLAAAGLAQPERFFGMLEAAGLLVQRLPLPDHHDFAALPWPDDAIDVVVTEKDAVKLLPAHTGRARVWVATLDFVPEPAFGAALASLLPPQRTAPA
jgi:tetraacyldisaccharide 4'-kinase